MSPALKHISHLEDWPLYYEYNFFVNGPSFAKQGGNSKFNYALSMSGKTVTTTPHMLAYGAHHWRLRDGWPPYPDNIVRREWIVHPDPNNFLCLDAWWDGPTLRVHGWECDRANMNQMWLVEYDDTKLFKVVYLRPRHSPEYCLTVNGLTSVVQQPVRSRIGQVHVACRAAADLGACQRGSDRPLVVQVYVIHHPMSMRNQTHTCHPMAESPSTRFDAVAVRKTAFKDIGGATDRYNQGKRR